MPHTEGGSKIKLLVIIPAYNEADSIERVICNLKKACPNYDYIVVNDGSTDDTAGICVRCNFPLINLPVNLGLAGAVRTGMKYAWENGYDAAVQFDGDGQHRPEYIAPMLEKITDGYDIVCGSRYVTEKRPITPRMLGSRLISAAIWITTKQRLSDPTSGLRMFNRRMIHEFAKQINHSPEPDTISYLIRKGAQSIEIQVSMDERLAGVSYLSSMNSVRYMLKMGISIILVQHFRGGTLPELSAGSIERGVSK